MIVPDNLYRNWNTYEKKVKNIGAESFFTLADPQTNGGLLVAVDAAHRSAFENFLGENGFSDYAHSIGKMTHKTDFSVTLI